MNDDYLIWSNERGAWRGPRKWGYVWRVENAGRYSFEEALQICFAAVPGRHGREPLREIPVRRIDVEFLVHRLKYIYPGHDPSGKSDRGRKRTALP